MDTAEARTTTGGEAGGPVYDAFLSYSHAADELLAPRLQAGLQRFAKPWWKRRALRIFRDEASLSANPHLWSSITDALDDSGWFVLLLSPEAAESVWVDREVEYWLEHKDPERIIPVVTEGEFIWSETDLDLESSAAPPALYGAFADEPRWVDLRFARSEEQLDLKNPRFSAAVADIASAVLDVPKDELESEEVKQHRRTTRTAWAAAIALVLLVLVATAAAAFAFTQQEEAQQQAQIARARELAAASLLNLDNDPELGILLALEAVDTATVFEGSAVSEPVTALHQALAASRVVLRVPGDELVAYSPDSSLVATALEEDAAIWDAETGRQIRVLPSPDGRKAALAAFSRDGRTLAISYADAGEPGPLVVLWDVATGELITTFDDPGLHETWAIDFSADGLLAVEASGDSGAPLVVWEVDSGTERYRIDHGDGHWVGGPSFSPAASLLGAVGSAGAMLYDAATGEEFASLEVPADWDLMDTAFDPTGRYLAAVSQFPPGVVIWNVDSGEVKTSWEAEGGPLRIEWSPSGQLIALSGNNPIPRLYDTDTGEEVLSLLGHDSPIHSIAFSPNGDRLVGAGLGGGGSIVWDVGPAVRREVATVKTPYPGVEWIAYSADGDSILVLSDEVGTGGTLARIDPDTSEVLARIPDQMSDFPLTSLLAPEAGLVASLNSDGSAALHDSQTFEPTVALPDGPYALAVSSDGTRALLNISASVGAPVVAEVGSWDVLVTLEEGLVWWASFSPDGDLLTAFNGFRDGWLIDIPTGSVVASFGGEDVPLDFSPDGSVFLVHTFSGGLRLLDVSALKAGTALEDAVVWEITAHNGMAPQAYFNPDGSRIVSMGSDSQIRVWDTQTGELVADFGGFGGSFPLASWHPDGIHLIAEDTNGTLQVLTLDRNELVDIAISRLTRGFTDHECTKYRIAPCPTLDQIQNR